MKQLRVPYVSTVVLMLSRGTQLAKCVVTATNLSSPFGKSGKTIPVAITSELSRAEKLEMFELLLCLMGNTSSNFTCFSVATYSMAKALESYKVYIKPGEKSGIFNYCY